MTSPSLESRVARIEGIFEGIIEELRARLASIEMRLNGVEDRIARLEDRVQSQFQWIVGIMLSMWITVFLAILLKV